MSGSKWQPGEKTHKDENFPVASRLIAKKYRAPILAFYKFARAADDVADHPDLGEKEKIETLDRFEETLLGHSDAIPDAMPLRATIEQNRLTVRHGQDLLQAFRMDACKRRYADWPSLMDYCALSAMPVGRFVLDVHGESRETWARSDALCAALQVINHLQDCGEDYHRLQRVYIPADAMMRHGVAIEALAQDRASPGLKAVIRDLASQTKDLLGEANLSGAVADFRLALEVAVIERLARKLTTILLVRDPLSERVHLSKPAVALTVAAAIAATIRRFSPPRVPFYREGSERG